MCIDITIKRREEANIPKINFVTDKIVPTAIQSVNIKTVFFTNNKITTASKNTESDNGTNKGGFRLII